MRIIDFLDRGALLYPQVPCLTDDSGDPSDPGHSHSNSNSNDGQQRSWTYAETVELSHRIACALQAANIGTNQPVAVLSPNDPMGYACMMGLLRAGAVWLPVSGRNPLTENLAVLAARRAKWLFYHSAYATEAAHIRAAVPSLLGAVCIDQPGEGAPALAQWMAPAGCPRIDVPEAPGQLAAIVSTGGTTGEPKGAMLPHRVFETMAATYLASMPVNLSVNERPVHLVVAPMTHGAGATTFPLLALGATQVFVAKPEPGAILAAIERHRVTHLFMPPTMIYMLLAHPQVRQHDYSSLRYFLYAAAPMAAEKVREALEVFGPVMAQTFGQVEAPMVCTYLSPQDHVDALAHHPERLLSCGRPTLLTRVAIMADDGQLLPQGERGEIVVQGSLVMSGYHDQPEASAEASAHGWHHTGDIGMMDSEGYVYIVDRKRDMIISGGFNIYPSEIEQVLWSHPAVLDAAVVGVPDDKWGEAVKAVVQLKPGSAVDTDALLAYCRDRLGSTKAPKSVEIWPDLPRSAVGKVLKKTIRERYWAGQARRI
jgi:acyl-CoA synthetase (AMP-forming)/AMP-acid ligase II